MIDEESSAQVDAVRPEGRVSEAFPDPPTSITRELQRPGGRTARLVRRFSRDAATLASLG
jgi:hypothetical protein